MYQCRRTRRKRQKMRNVKKRTENRKKAEKWRNIKKG